MRPLGSEEIVDLETYEALRPQFRDAVIALKRERRVAVGDRVTLVFENRETLRFQVQEMLRVERIRDAARVQHELDVYNELMPGESELSATLFVEITEPARIKPELDRLVGIDAHVFLVLGEDEDEVRLPARFDATQMEADRISAVQYIRFRLSKAERARLGDGNARARLRIDHANYRHEAEVSPALRAQLLADLAGACEPLLQPGPAAAASDEVLLETTAARVFRPAHPEAPGHVVVEARDPKLSLLEADVEALHELLSLVQRFAREIAATRGSCRVVAEAGATPLRWHLLG